MDSHYLPQISLLRLLAVLALVLTPHLFRVPAWEIMFILALLGWRALAALRQWQLPGTALRSLLTLAACAGVIASYGRVNGQHAGTALLVIMAALKLLEMRSRRDVMVTVFLLYFILITHFLFSQEIWTIAYLLACTVAITALLIEVNHPREPLPVKLLLRMSAAMVAYAMPLMVVIFILFPRIPGPLWGLPADSGAERSGLPDSMSPGGISRLIFSNEVAFRVRFEGKVPPMRDRYWRGPVFDIFDGRTWKEGNTDNYAVAPAVEFSGEPVRYEVVLEPQRTAWLMALDLPSAEVLPPQSYINSRQQLIARQPVRERMLYQALSYPRYRLQATLNARQRREALQVPSIYNPSTQQLAHSWRAEGLDDQQIIQRALKMFREEKFYYTLRPPPLGRDSVDNFLFGTRKGFCEHYASAFTFLMRAAGIPAHVVAGYMGGEQNEFGDYYVVRQSDAHAWSEVWLEGKGWVRVDPTSAVSPDRIEKGISDAPELAGELPDFLARRGNILGTLEARWDWANNAWNRMVLAYGPELQEEFLRNFGIRDWSDMILSLTVITTLMMSVFGLLLMRQFAPASNEDAALKLWRRALKKLHRFGIAQLPHEGPRDFVERLAHELPEAAPVMRKVLGAYLQLRYLREPAPQIERELASAVRALL